MVRVVSPELRMKKNQEINKSNSSGGKSIRDKEFVSPGFNHFKHMKSLDYEEAIMNQPISASFPESMNGLMKQFDDK